MPTILKPGNRVLVPLLLVTLLISIIAVNHGGRTHALEENTPPKLSPEAAQIVALHLAIVVRSLKNAGMPDPAAKGQSEHKKTHTDYSKAQYINDYRASFLKSWSWFFREVVMLDSDGAPVFSDSLPFNTGGSQGSSGVTEGHWDGLQIASDLQAHAILQPKHHPHIDSPDERRLSPGREAILYIAKEIVGGLRLSDAGVEERLGTIKEN